MPPSGSIAGALAAAGPGGVVCLAAGVHRPATPLTPLDRQSLVGLPGAVLSGAVVVSQWQRSGSAWYAAGTLPAQPKRLGECVTGYQGCRYAETVFRDGAALDRVDRREQLRHGKVYADYAANKIWIADDPAGHVLEVARTPAAVTGTAHDVVVRGLVVERFANPAQRGAVEPHGPRWLIVGNEVRLNHGHGVQISSDGVIVRGNRLHHNGQLGLGAGEVNGQLVEDNEIDHNNTAGFARRWEAGGAKWAETRNLRVRRNNAHDNGGPGLWTDINCVDVTFEDNTVTGNAGGGIRHEISFRALIRNNTVRGNGATEPHNGWGSAGIEVAGSSEVEVDHNTVTDNTNGIVLAQQYRPDHPSPMGPHELSDVWVHDNVVGMPQGVTGMVNDTGDQEFYERGIRFERNTYRLPTPSSRAFAWRNGPWAFDDWQHRLQHDVAGSLVAG